MKNEVIESAIRFVRALRAGLWFKAHADHPRPVVVDPLLCDLPAIKHIPYVGPVHYIIFATDQHDLCQVVLLELVCKTIPHLPARGPVHTRLAQARKSIARPPVRYVAVAREEHASVGLCGCGLRRRRGCVWIVAPRLGAAVRRACVMPVEPSAIAAAFHTVAVIAARRPEARFLPAVPHCA